MIRNYFKIALRSLIRHKSFTLINMLGLVLGISFSTMLYTYVSHELSYDSFHKKADRAFRVITIDESTPGNSRTLGHTVPPMGPQLVNSFPEVKEMTRLFRLAGQVIVDIDGTKHNERNWFTAPDANFFNIFDFDFIAGDKATALNEPYSVVLTESTSKKYFSNGNALGRIVKTTAGEVKVTGVIKDLPVNSHLQFDLVFSTIRSGKEWETYLNNWQRLGAFTYVVLEEGKSIDDVQAKMPAFMEKHWGPDAAFQSTQFQSIQDIYLHSAHIESGIEITHGETSYIYIFSTMGIFLLIVAAINYINLTTSKASLRSKEIGLRKVVGAIKAQLIVQFLTEAFVVTLLSMLISMVAIDLCFPLFNSITGKNFDLTLSTLGDYMPSLLLITLLIGIMAGSYPAFYLSKLKPVTALKGKPLVTPSRIDLRTALVVFQFTITIVLIVSTLTISDQIKFIQTKDMGFDKEQMMVIDINSRTSRAQFKTMKNEFSRLAGVKQVAVSSNVPGEWKEIEEIYVRKSSSTTIDSLQTYFMGFDEDVLDTYKLQLTAGDFFSGLNEADSMNVLLNASAVKAMNLESPIGSKIRISFYGIEWEANVIGVLNDFNFQSLHQKIAPIIIGYHNNPVISIDYFTLKVAGVTPSLIEKITKVHEKFDTQTSIEYHFLSDQLNRFYVAEEKAGKIFQMGGLLSMLVACLGLLGLAAYQVESKTKELGIRKILGAGPLNLFFMVSLSFTKKVLLAFVLACPFAWYIMHEWLSAFEYRIPLRADAFILTGIFVLLLVLLTVSYQSLKAALDNPIHSLKQE